MAGALLQPINLSTSVLFQRKVEPMSKQSAHMLCRLQKFKTSMAMRRSLVQPINFSSSVSAQRSSPVLRMRDFSGLRGANGIDEALIISSGAGQTLHSTIVSATRGTGNRIAHKAMFERFTEKAIKVIILSQEEARRLGQNFVGTEQILLGLIADSTGIAAQVLKSMGINLKDARVEVEKIIGGK